MGDQGSSQDTRKQSIPAAPILISRRLRQAHAPLRSSFLRALDAWSYALFVPSSGRWPQVPSAMSGSRTSATLPEHLVGPSTTPCMIAARPALFVRSLTPVPVAMPSCVGHGPPLARSQRPRVELRRPIDPPL
ncbi:hypothetical protein BV20DRAFT_619819 [Pilatotrama ljubarskyi]|nr:hypothetical protein BV20DRAFT_619819 [Pilatotrama ljubarskyi]